MRMLKHILLAASAAFCAAAADAPATNRFGFTGPEIFPLENQISLLKNADLDGDGLQDLLLANNARSRISILYNQTGKTSSPALPAARVRREINELPADARFKIDSISSEKRISSLLVADLNGDRRLDLAYYGEPRELILQYNEGGRKWSAPKRVPIEDATLDPYALTFGDLNHDQRTDLLLLAEGHINFLAQKADGTLAEPEKIAFAGAVKSIQALDIQGDGRDDLLLVNWDNPNPFRFRLQNASAQLGPEIHFSQPPVRSYWADDLDADRRTEIVTIAAKSGRAQIYNFRAKPAEELLGDWRQGQFQILPLAKTGKARRGVLWADLNGDGRSDLLVAEPDSGQISLSVQAANGSLDESKRFATLTGITELASADWDGDGRAEIFMLSLDERQIGVATLDENGKLGFPKPVGFEGRPLALAAGMVRPGEKPAAAAIVDLDGKRELQIRGASGDLFRKKLEPAYKANPDTLLIHDANQDGVPDLLVLTPYEKIKILLGGSASADFAEIDLAPPGGNADQPWVSTADVDGDGKLELLLPQKNFLRAVVLKSTPAWAFEVKEQINGAASNSRLAGAAALPEPGQKVPALFLLDAERKALALARRSDAGVWEVAKNIPLPFTDFRSLRSVAIGGVGPSAISLLGLNAVGWMRLSGEVWEFAELDGYETPIKDGFLHDVVSGDLNGDKRKDLVFMETAKSYLDLVTFEPPHQLVPANRWQVFEERTFRNSRNQLPEPREALIADLTGDGKNDLAVLVHDRILVYPQE